MINLKYKKNGFTLIELLTVVAVIGLLSSVILVSIKSAQDQARYNKSLQLSSSIKNALYTNIIGDWGCNNSILDSSGNNNHGTILQGFTSDSQGVNREGYRCNNTSCYIFVPNSDKLNNKSNTITFEGWIKPESITSNLYLFDREDSVYYSIQYSPSGNWEIWINYGFFNLEDISQAQGRICYGVTINAPLKLNKYNHFVVSFDGRNDPTKLKLYLNAELVEETNCDGGFILIINPEDDLDIGVGSGSIYTIDEMKIYDSYLSLSQVKKLYAEGIKKHM